MTAIVKVYARQILNSQGDPTIEVEVHTKKGAYGMASVPSGSTTGKYEALEIIDGDQTSWMGKSVQKAIDNVNNIISPALMGINISSQKRIDKIMIDLDGTKNKENLGANAIYAVSIASAKAAASEMKMHLYDYIAKMNKTSDIWLPIPLFNILNGGMHSENNIDFQEYMIFPIAAKNYHQALEWAYNVFKNLEIILEERKLITEKGKEGGFSPNLKSNEEGVQLVVEAIKRAGYKPGKDIMITLDIAAKSLYNSKTKKYDLKCNNKSLSTNELINYYGNLVKNYPIISMEDPLIDTDIKAYQKLYHVLGKKIQIVGDDLFVTNKNLLRKYAPKSVANAMIIKPNQIGTLTEAIEIVSIARKYKYNCIVSHRSAETSDNFLADFAVGINSGQIKAGSLWGSERTAKYNRFIRIGERISDKTINKELKKYMK